MTATTARPATSCRRNPRACPAGVLLLLVAAPAGANDGPLHVPSPDWRDQVVYFAMTDRFADGDPGNNDQGTGEYDPADGRRYSGGDLVGLRQRLDYIQGLGATALWITPPVAGQWWSGSYGGYHGYWTSDFKAVDAHYGTLAEYQALSRALHGRGMYLVQDVVVNHTADYLRCTPVATGAVDAAEAADADADPGTAARRCAPRTDGTGRSAPQPAPFDRNDPRDPAQRAAAIYHWTPPITDFSNRRQELDYQLADLDDLDTENPVVRRALRDAYGWWIRNAGVDAFRIDTAYHVPAAFFADFLHADDPAAPGMARIAAATGRHDFLAFGEGFGADRAFDDSKARKLDGYMREPGGLRSMIDFPLYGTLGDVFARGRPTAELAYRLHSRMTLHADPHRMPTFIDNHDVDRFLAEGSEAGLKQALLALMTLPGIPVLWQGTEQGFREQRASMFAGGHGSDGRDHFDTDAPLYRYLQRTIALRQGDRLYSRGTPVVLADNPAAAGALAYLVRPEGCATAAPGEAPQGAAAPAGCARGALVVFNSADHPSLLDRLDTGLAPGTRLEPAFGIQAPPAGLVVAADGTVTLPLAARAGLVWRVAHATGAEATATIAATPEPPTLAAVPASVAGDFVVRGQARGPVQVVVDGDLSRAVRVPVDADGRWQATVDTGGMIDPGIVHRVVAYDAAAGVASMARSFRAVPDWTLVADVADPDGDDHGPRGTYRYPTEPGWAELHPADLQRVRAWTAGGALKVELTLRGISTGWNPTNGFDRVAFTAFLQLPGRAGGLAEMPLQRETLPGGMRWHVRWRAHGWSNALFSAEGAGAGAEGATLSPGADLAVDREARTVTFTIPATSLGSPGSLAGARLYITTWDYDAGFRALRPEGGAMAFGGGDGDRDPLWMDASAVIELR